MYEPSSVQSVEPLDVVGPGDSQSYRIHHQDRKPAVELRERPSPRDQMLLGVAVVGNLHGIRSTAVAVVVAERVSRPRRQALETACWGLVVATAHSPRQLGEAVGTVHL